MQPHDEEAQAGTSEARRGGTSRWWIPGLLAVAALGGLSLVLFGGSTESGDDDAGRGDTLELTDTDADAVAELADLELPASTSEFLSARLDDDSQLDVTLTMDPSDEAGFLADSGFAAPEPDERVIFHASPLWEMNVEGTIRGVTDTTAGSGEQVRRSLELLEEGDQLRVRLVLTPA